MDQGPTASPRLSSATHHICGCGGAPLPAHWDA